MGNHPLQASPPQNPPYGPSPYPPSHAPKPFTPRRRIPIRAGIYLTVLVLGGIGLLVRTLQGNVESKRSYIVFDGDASLHARVDGKDLGPARSATSAGVLTRSLPAGSHRIELVDTTGNVVSSATATIPAAGYRAILSSKPQRYAIVTVKYDHVTPPKVDLLPAPVGGLTVITSSSLLASELGDIDGTFPVSGTGSDTRLCRLDPTGRPTCLPKG